MAKKQKNKRKLENSMKFTSKRTTKYKKLKCSKCDTTKEVGIEVESFTCWRCTMFNL